MRASNVQVGLRGPLKQPTSMAMMARPMARPSAMPAAARVMPSALRVGVAVAPLRRSPGLGLRAPQMTRMRAGAQALQADPKEDAMRWLATRIISECRGKLGNSEEEVLRRLRSLGIECSYVKNRKRLFRVPGEDVQVYASEVIRSLQEGSLPLGGQPAAAAAAPRASAPAAPAAASSPSGSAGLEGLAAWISANYSGMGKSAADALPELRRAGVAASGNGLTMKGSPVDGPGIAQALRLQPRTPSRPSTPQPSRPSAPAAAPLAPAAASSPSGSAGLEGLAAWISANYMGMGKSAADALPELRRAGVAASGNGFTMKGSPVDGPGIAQALRLQARTPSRPSTPQRSRPSAPAASSAAPSAPAAAPAAPAAAPAAPAAASSPSGSAGLEGLAAWISANYMGMGKSAADALPELRRAGVAASGSGFTMKGSPVDGPGIAQALRLQPRTPSRPSTPQPSRPSAPAASSAPPATPAAPAAAPSSAGAGAGLEGLAAWISANYMGMGKSAADALPELRRAGVAASGNSYSLKGQLMGPEEIAQALRLQARTPSRPSTPPPSRPSAPAASSAAPSAPAAAPAAASSPSGSAGLEGLAAWISANYMGMGKSAADALPELRRAGVAASGNGFTMKGSPVDGPGIAQALRLQPRTPSRPSSPQTSRPSAPSAPAAAPAAPAASSPSGSAGLEGLAAWISANYMGMGKSAADALPELRRAGVAASGNGFTMKGSPVDGPGIAQALRLQPRTPSRPSTPQPSRPSAPAAAPSAPAAAPAAPAAASSPSGGAGLEGLAAWISANYMGMGKSAADSLPELRRAGVAASGNGFTMKGLPVDGPGIAQALRLQARTPSRPSTPQPSRPSAPAAAPSAPAPVAPAAASSPTGSAGLEGLAAWIATNYSGMGKSAADALPELRRAGVAASGSGFTMKGSPVDGPGIAQALRLQPRTPSRPSTPQPSRPSAPAASSAAPSASAAASSPSGSAGLEGLAAWISANYMGMGKSAADALPELRRAGVAASGNGFTMKGSPVDGPGIAQALRLQPRTPSRPSTPQPSRPSAPAASSAPPAAPAAPAAAPSSAGAGAGLEGLAAWISANYSGMGKSAMDALPELRRAGVAASGNSFSLKGQPMSPPEIAQALRLEARPSSRAASPARTPQRSAPAPRAPSPPPPTTFGAKAGGPSELSPSEAIKAGTEWLAAWISANYVGMGKSAADALPELRRRGVVCTYVKDGHHLFRYPGEPTQVDAHQVAKLLNLRPR